MCRNIRVLHNFKPPTTRDEMHAASLQYVRKVSGIHEPSQADLKTFDRAVEEVARATEKLLGKLSHHGKVRTREEEREKGRARWLKRQAQMAAR